MRRFIAMLLALLLAATLPAALSEGALTGNGDTMIGEAPIGDAATPEGQAVSCPEQGFSTLTAPSLKWYYEELGVYIDLGSNEDSPWILISRADAPGSQFDAQGYFDNVLTPQMQDDFGSDLVSVGQYQTYTVAGVETHGVMYTYKANGRDRVCFVLFALREDGFVRYEARYYADDSEDCMSALCIAVYYYQPDAYYYGGAPAPQSEPEPEPEPQATVPPTAPDTTGTQTASGDTYEGKTIISVPEQGFSTLTSTQVGSQYVEGDGLYIYTEDFGYIPFAQIYVMGNPPADLEAYIDEQVTPYMQQQYGQDLISVQELGQTTLGGRPVVAAKYTYNFQGYVIEMIRAYDQREGRTLMYIAKYFQGEGNAAVAALEEAVAAWQGDPDYYYNAPSAPATLDGGSGDSLPNCDDSKPQNPDDGGPVDPAPDARPDVTGLNVLSCPQLGFATAVNPAYNGIYEEGDGLYVTAHGDTGIPYVLVYRTGDTIAEPAEFIKEQYTPHMREQYGDDLRGVVEYEYYDVGGKQLAAARYTYKVQEYMVDMLRLYEVTPTGTVVYTAKFLNGEGDETLAALDDIVRYMQPDANYYN